MFKVAVAVALVALASAASVNVDRTFQVQPSFEEWRAQFSKTYVSDVEASERAQIYADNIALINEHNTKYAAGEATFTMGVNEYTDMTHEEFKALFIGPKVPAREQTNVADMPKLTKLTGTAGSVDWRAKGAVTPVKNQGQCGSCWSFSTTGSTEGAHQIATGKLVSLSEQQLMDCSTAEGDHSCQGGLMDFAFKYIIQNGGLDTEQDYPYQMRNEPCKTAKEQNKVVSISGYKDIPQGSEEALTSALNIGPVSVAIEADQVGFQHYQSGVFSGVCGTKLDHGVLAVGFGTEGGQDYYIVKNSWGATWGMEGYIMMARGKNECGIANSASYPIAGSGPAPGPAPPGPPPPPPPPPPGPSDCKDYCDPNAGPCAEGEKVQITGIAGSFCSPKCGLLKACPTDVPDGATAKPECVLETAGSSRPTQCALICTPGADAGECPNKATCKPIQGTGVCTYDS